MAEQQGRPAGASPPAGGTSGTSLTRMLLFGVLGLLVVALAYDYLWARKQHQAAVKAIEALIADPKASQVISEAEPLTPERIEAALQCQPSEKSEGQNYEEHRYSWRSGLPWRTHNIYVIYAKGKSATEEEILFFHDFSDGAAPDPVQYPGPSTTGLPEPDVEKLKAEHEAKQTESSDAPPPPEEAATGEAPAAAAAPVEGGDASSASEAAAEAGSESAP